MNTTMTCRIQWTVILAVALLAGCKKQHDYDGPVQRGQGRVVLVNTEEPVREALVRFLGYQSGSGWGSGSYYEIGSALTDKEGYFDIPDDPDLEVMKAYGNTEWFYDMGEVTSAYQSPVLELYPRAWLRITAQDVEPVNPEYEGVSIDMYPNSGPNDLTDLDEPKIYPAIGNYDTYILYRLNGAEGIPDEYISFFTSAAVPFDTTDFVIEY